jgi:hypothetical protein
MTANPNLSNIIRAVKPRQTFFGVSILCKKYQPLLILIAGKYYNIVQEQ